MAQSRLPMRKIRDVLRLSAAGLSKRQIAASLGHRPDRCRGVPAPGAGGRYQLAAARRSRRRRAGAPPVSGACGHGQGLAVAAGLAGDPSRVAPQGRDAAAGVGGVSRHPSRRLRLQPVLRTVSRLGRPPVADDAAGARGRREAVRRLRRHDDRHCRRDDRRGACLPAVRRRARRVELHLCRGDLTQTLPDWIGSHTRAFAFFGGVPAMVVSDNLKSGITKACFYEPAVNRTYAEMAAHYDTAIVPARPQEAARQGQGRSRRAGRDALDHRQAAGTAGSSRSSELNAAIRRAASQQLNDRVSRHLGASRRALFEATRAIGA